MYVALTFFNGEYDGIMLATLSVYDLVYIFINEPSVGAGSDCLY